MKNKSVSPPREHLAETRKRLDSIIDDLFEKNNIRLTTSQCSCKCKRKSKQKPARLGPGAKKP